MIDLFYGSWVQEDFLEGNTDSLKLLIPVRLKDSRFHKFGSNECRLLHKLHCMPVLQCWESHHDIIIWHKISKVRKCTLVARQKSLDKITFYIESEWRSAFHPPSAPTFLRLQPSEVFFLQRTWAVFLETMLLLPIFQDFLSLVSPDLILSPIQ